MKKILLSCGVFISANVINAQNINFTSVQHNNQQTSTNFAEYMTRPDANLYQAQHLFHLYWQGKDSTERGKGYKAFKRWEDFVSPRVYPSGNIGLIGQTAKNFQDFLDNNQTGNTNTGGKIAPGGNLIASATWTPIGPFGALAGSAGGQLNKAGRLCFITVHPTNTLSLWVGAPAGGLWHSLDGGTTWTTNTDNLGVIGCSDLAIDPVTPTNMYLATGDGDAGDTQSIGVMKSTDGGSTWSASGLVFSVGTNNLIRRLIINPSNPLILLAATNSGIYRTVNGGTSWTNVQASNCYDLEFQPGNPNTVYAAGTTFRRSTDGGVTWTQISNGIPTTGATRMAIAVTPANNNMVYVLAGNNTNSGMLGVYQSTTAGVSFINISPGGGVNLLGWNSNGLDVGGQDWYDLAIAASPLNANEVITGGVNIWRTTNAGAGATWSIYGHWTGTGAPFIHADHHNLIYNSAGTIYGTNDGTVYKRTGATWTEICGNMNISEIYKLGTSALTANKWISGHQDNGTNIWNGTTYSASIGGDGMDCFIDRTNDNNMFGETYNGSFRRSTNAGVSWSSYTTGISGTAPWVAPWKQDPQTAGVIYGGYTNLFKSTLAAGSWTQLAALPAGGTVIEFAVAPSNSLVIYVLKSGGIYKSVNGGAAWSTITGTVPVGSGAPTFITICPTDPNKAWVTLSGYSAGNKVFRTTDGGTTWTNFTGNLPNLPANCSVYQAGSSDRIYVGMDVGVYYRDNVAASWTLYNTGLPNMPVKDMEISPADPTKLVAASYGRGTWVVSTIANLPPVSSFTYSGSPCTGSPIMFTDVSTNGPTTWTWSVAPVAGVTINTPSAQNPTITFANSGVYTVSLTTSNGAGPGTVATQTINITATPTVAVTSSVQTICSGATASITASGATSYSWSNGALTNTVGVTPSATAIYTVTGTTGSCVSTAKTATVNVNPSPTVAVASASICAGSSTVLTASGATSYSWSTGGLTNTINVTPSVTTVYTVIGTSAGCTNVKTTTVTVSAMPTVAVTGSVQTICVGSAATITASGATSYSWSAGPVTNTISVNPTVTTVYTVTGSNGGCSSNKTATINVTPSPTVSVSSPTICGGSTVLTASGASSYSWSNGSLTNTTSVSPGVTTVYTVTGTTGGCTNVKTCTVTVNSLSMTVTNSVQTICPGTTTVITASGATTYSWSTGANTNTISITPSATTVYSVTGTTGACNNTQVFTITVGGNPTVVISNNTQTICAGSSATINSSGAATYFWNTGATTSSISISPSSTTVYTVTGFAGSCSTAQTATVNVNPLPSLSITPNTTVVCEGERVSLSGSGANSYTWQPLNQTGSVITDTPAATQIYTLTGTDANGCVGSQTMMITVSTCAGILQNGLESVVFTIFPNPATENITVHFPSANSAELNIEVLDAAGKLISQKVQSFSKVNPDMQINISHIARGVYFIKLIPKEGAAKTVKLLKE